MITNRCSPTFFISSLSLLLGVILLSAIKNSVLGLEKANSLENTQQILSHPPLRPAPTPSKRPLQESEGVYFVDPVNGNDSASGEQNSPWKTINHALAALQPGDVLYLRGGKYFENIYCAVAGTPEQPIVIRSYPGELAVINGGLREFQETPESAWVPAEDGVEGEYRSAQSYKNIRDVLGIFGDSRIGLQTYWHRSDLQAFNEMWIPDPEEKRMIEPIYCGPGVWYDKQTGYIHIRLAHTNLETEGIQNYQGETDPRRLPLTIVPFNNVPLFLDQAMHIRFQDLVIEGGGHDAVEMQFGVDVEFDNVTIYAGTYGLRARGTGQLRFIHSAIHGMIAPWMWRGENVLQGYDPLSYDPFLPPAEPNNARHISRLPTHALLVPEGTYEFEVFAYPKNHDWEIAYSEFTDAHDGVYLGGKNIRFHHNWVDRIQDDGIYISSPVPHYNDNVRIYQNLITQSLMAFGGHSRGGPDGKIYIYRNIADLRQGVQGKRPIPDNPQGEVRTYHIFLIHGRRLLGIESLYFYQNTFISPAVRSAYLHRLWVSTTEGTQRRIFNNLCVYLNQYPPADPVTKIPAEHDVQMDGNLHWSFDPDSAPQAGFLEKVRESAGSRQNQSTYPAGWEANSFIAHPEFIEYSSDPKSLADYRLKLTSPAVGKGVLLPEEWPDPLRLKDEVRPDIGALPLGSNKPTFGRYERITFPINGKGKR